MHENIPKFAIVLGTRPEIIKMAPVVKECQGRGAEFFILHTGQHYSYEMDRVFFTELRLPQAKYNLDVGSGLHGEQTGRMLSGIERVLLKESPDLVLVEGDTNSVFAGALAATKLHIKVGHVEAGLRSGDRHMPEEINRILTDHVSDFLFAPTEEAKANLLAEGIARNKVFVTGNTIVDAVQQHLDLALKNESLLPGLGLKKDSYFLVTAHREENVDSVTRLGGILAGLGLACAEFGLPVVFPVHPRTQKKMQEFGLSAPRDVRIISPVGYLDFLLLEARARLVFTDSGGVQEEACILKVPCVTLRDNTERPETIQVGANLLAGCDSERILEAATEMMRRSRGWANPFGDGRAAQRIVTILLRGRYGENISTEPPVPSKIR